MTTLIVGLGNPGPEYERTRHNAGFLALDWLRDQWSAPEFHPDSKFSAETSSLFIGGDKVMLVKPLTHMNESGRSVRALLDYYQLPSTALIVIHDDLDLASGTLRTTDSSRSAGHNGVQSIIDAIGTQDFRRIRLGIGRPTETEGVCMPSHDYVLGRFSTEERARLTDLFEATGKSIREYLG